MSDPILVNVTVYFELGMGSSGFTYIVPSTPPDGVTFGGTPIAHASLSATTAPNNWAFVYTLQGPGVGDTLVWDESPFVWTTEQPPHVQPGFTLPSPGANQKVFGVHNDNNSPEQEKFGFHLRVILNPNTPNAEAHESPDPEIVLDPPPP